MSFDYRARCRVKDLGKVMQFEEKRKGKQPIPDDVMGYLNNAQINTYQRWPLLKKTGTLTGNQIFRCVVQKNQAKNNYNPLEKIYKK